MASALKPAVQDQLLDRPGSAREHWTNPDENAPIGLIQ